MKAIITSLLTTSILLSSCGTLNQLGLKPSVLETILALKEILNSSTFRAISKLKELKSDDPTKVLPAEFQSVLASLKVMGYAGEIDKVSKQVGTASSVVLAESESIILESIKEVDFGDAVSVVMGGKDAATQVLKNNMKTVVKKKYAERLDKELVKTDALKFWPLAAGAYNIISKNKVDTSLSNFLADKAVDAVFLSIGHQEEEIRKDYKSLGVNVVNKVFDYYTKDKAVKKTNV